MVCSKKIKESGIMIDNKLLTFIILSEEKNYTRAAEILHMTQPAVTMHIKKLEEYFKCKLFERSMKLTEEGKIILDFARLSVASEEILRKRLSKIELPLNVGATLSIADYYLPKYLLHRVGDKVVNYSIQVSNTEVLTEKMLNGSLACSLVEGIFDPAVFEAREFCNAEFKGVVSACHPLAGKKINFDEVFKYPLIIREKGSGTRNIFEGYIGQMSKNTECFPKIIEIGSFMLIKKLLYGSDAVSFMYSEVAREEVDRGRLAYLEIENFDLKKPLHFIYPKNSIYAKENKKFFKTLFSDF